jgi:hypothetical protein
VFLIKRTDTGVVDVLTSNSPTAPTLPTNYTLFRWIGAMKPNGSSQWLPFTQNGDDFMWNTASADVSVTNLGSTPTLFTLGGVPTGLKVVAFIRGIFNDATQGQTIKISSPDETSSAVDDVSGNRNGEIPLSNIAIGYELRVRTNANAQIRAVTSNGSNTSTFRVVSYGWSHDRGRSA